MNKKLIAPIIPTRKRVDRLLLTLRSLVNTASDWSRVEPVLKIDDDDIDTIAAIPRLEAEFGLKHVITPRGVGYNDMGRFVTEACAETDATWVWLVDDDAWVEGRGWDDFVASVAPVRNVIQPQIYHLGGSKYYEGCGPVALIVPNQSWTLHGSPSVTSPADECWRQVLVVQNGYAVHLMKGITYRHDRDNDEALAAHRLR